MEKGTIFAFGFSKKYDISLLLMNVGYWICVGQSTDLPVLMPTSGQHPRSGC
jgi:hypothetical protein